MPGFLLSLAIVIGSAAAEVPFTPLTEVFTPSSLDGGTTIQSQGYRFEVFDQGEDGVLIRGSGKDGASITKTIDDLGHIRPERLFLFSVPACGQAVVELIIQSYPSRLAESPERRYTRVVFDASLSRSIAVFYDSSISIFNAVVPLEAFIEGPLLEFGDRLVCKNGEPKLVSGVRAPRHQY